MKPSRNKPSQISTKNAKYANVSSRKSCSRAFIARNKQLDFNFWISTRSYMGDDHRVFGNGGQEAFTHFLSDSDM